MPLGPKDLCGWVCWFVWWWCGSVTTQTWPFRVTVPRLSVVAMLQVAVYSSVETHSPQELRWDWNFEIERGGFNNLRDSRGRLFSWLWSHALHVNICKTEDPQLSEVISDMFDLGGGIESEVDWGANNVPVLLNVEPRMISMLHAPVRYQSTVWGGSVNTCFCLETEPLIH